MRDARRSTTFTSSYIILDCTCEIPPLNLVSLESGREEVDVKLGGDGWLGRLRRRWGHRGRRRGGPTPRGEARGAPGRAGGLVVHRRAGLEACLLEGPSMSERDTRPLRNDRKGSDTHAHKHMRTLGPHSPLLPSSSLPPPPGGSGRRGARAGGSRRGPASGAGPATCPTRRVPLASSCPPAPAPAGGNVSDEAPQVQSSGERRKDCRGLK